MAVSERWISEVELLSKDKLRKRVDIIRDAVRDKEIELDDLYERLTILLGVIDARE